MFMEISVQDIHNDMIKPSENDELASVFDSVTQKVLISYTTLRPFIPPLGYKMTPRLCQICACDLCIITKDMHIDLNRFRRSFVIDLQQKSVVRHTYNSLFSTKTFIYYKDKLFPDGECLHVAIKYEA